MSDLPPTHERLGTRRQSSVVRYFTLIMSVLYALVGVALLLAPAGTLNLPNFARYLLAGVFVFYGIIRFVRTYQQYFTKNRDDAR